MVAKARATGLRGLRLEYAIIMTQGLWYFLEHPKTVTGISRNISKERVRENFP